MGFPSPYRNFVIHCVLGLAAEEYAIKHGFQIAHLRTITLDDETANVAYMNVRTGGTYWDLPVPIGRNHLFYGWNTATVGGERVMTETVVTATTDHTPYARWLLWGNVTGDGMVDSQDLNLLQRHINSFNSKVKRYNKNVLSHQAQGDFCVRMPQIQLPTFLQTVRHNLSIGLAFQMKQGDDII